MPQTDVTPIYGEAGGALNVDPLLLQAIGHVESGGTPDPDKAVSPAGARGRMQVMPPNLKRYNVSDPTDPRQNIYAGAAVLDEALTAANGNVPLALRIYQGGQDQTKWGPNNAAYPGKVAAAYQALAQRATPAQGAPVAQAATPDATDTFLTGGTGAGAPKPAEAKPDATDDFLTGKVSTPPPATTAATTDQPTMLKTGSMSADAIRLLPSGPPSLPTGPGMDALPSESPGAAGPDRLGAPPNSAPTTTLNQPTTGPLPAPVERIGQALSEGWNAPNPLMSPELRAMIEKGGPVGNLLTSPLLQIGGKVLNVAGAGTQAVIGEAGNALLPGLGRDLNILAQVAPFARVGTGLPLTPGVAPEAPAPGPRFVSEHYAPPPVPGGNALDRINQLIAHDDAERAGNGPQTQTNLLAHSNGAPPPEPSATMQPAPAPNSNQAWVNGLRNDVQNIVQANQAAGVPGDLSAAATPEQLAALTPEQMKAYRRVQELRDILSPPEPGIDKNTYVEGSKATLAEYSGDPVTSQAESVLRQRNPDAFNGPDGTLTANNTARVKKFDDLAGSDVQTQDLREQQRAAAEADTARILRTARPADLQPALEVANSIVNDPRMRESDAVRKIMTPLRDALFDADGKLKTDPQSVWGMHDNLINKLETAKSDTAAERFAITQLNTFKKSLDGVMNTATNGNFQTFLDNQAGYLKQINANNLLQKFRTTMTDKQGNILPDRFHRFVTDLAVRRGMPGVNAAMDIPDETMTSLIDIDKDLKRAGNIDLGKARGSPTNLYFEVAQALGLAGAHAIVGASGAGGVGNLFLQQGLNIAAPKIRGWRINSLTQKHLAPPPGGYNALQPPNY